MPNNDNIIIETSSMISIIFSIMHSNSYDTLQNIIINCVNIICSNKYYNVVIICYTMRLIIQI